MEEKVLEVKHMNFSYGKGHKSLKDVSVIINKHDKIAVLGANGAGKSTFFLNLNGVREPESGEIYFHGEKINHKNRNMLRKNVGIVFQEADNQIIASTVKAEVAFGPMNLKYNRTEVERRTMHAIGQMNLLELADRPPHYLSGGEKKRVSIADILAMETEVVIFDEPTASLDPLNAEMLEDILRKIEKEGKTILVSTHDLDFAYRFADRILVFNGGRLVGDGNPEVIFHDEKLLQEANLKKPVYMEIYDMLQSKGIVKETKSIPKNIAQLSQLFDNNKR